MLKRIIFPFLLTGLMLVTTSQISAQKKSYEKKVHDKIEKSDDMNMDNCKQMSKCIEKIAENTEMRNLMLQKLNDSIDKVTPVPIGLENIKERSIQLNKTNLDNSNSIDSKVQPLKKTNYKRR